MAGRVHTTKIRVRYAECDSMQFVHHAKFVEYFELGRTDWIRCMARSYGDLEKEGILLPVVHFQIRFHIPARYDQELTIETSVKRVTKLQIDFGNRVVDASGQKVHCEGEVGLACINREGRPQRIPAELLEPLTHWLDAAATQPTGSNAGSAASHHRERARR